MQLHPLKDKWFVYYVPAVKQGENYKEAKKKELDYVTTIEEVYATINALPNFTLMPCDDSIVFSRNKIDPKYESFPGGVRYSIFCRTKSQSVEAILYILAAVLGESISRDACEGNSVCDVIGISHRLGKMYKDAVRIEVWSRRSNYTTAIAEFLTKTVSSIPGLSVQTKEMN